MDYIILKNIREALLPEHPIRGVVDIMEVAVLFHMLAYMDMRP